MKLEKTAAIAEIVSSIAIVLTLIYLAIQAHQTNNALLASSRQGTMAADVTIVAALINSPESWENLTAPFSELSVAEQGQVSNVLAGLLRVREYAWFQYKNGILDQATLQSYLAPIARWLELGDTRIVWEQFSQELDKEFVDYVNKLIEQTPPRGSQ